ncbi:MAG: Fis family transcriptional regulator [Methylotenera sp.]|nr:MAG: Fis family transcriptional regulator [Methylotenera sp.]
MSIQHIGSNFNDFLNEEDLLESVTALALKRVIALQIEQEMSLQKITKATLAKKMDVALSVVNELLDINDTNLTLISLVSAASILGKTIRVELVEETSVT